MFKIVFYKSDNGELAHLKTLYREAEKLQELVQEPPEEFFEMLQHSMPIHGWAEIEDDKATVFVIFAPRGERQRRLERLTGIMEIDEEEENFHEWLGEVKPSDFNTEF